MGTVAFELLFNLKLTRTQNPLQTLETVLASHVDERKLSTGSMKNSKFYLFVYFFTKFYKKVQYFGVNQLTIL